MEKNLQSSWLEVAKTNVFNHSLRVEVPKKLKCLRNPMNQPQLQATNYM